MLCKLLLLYQKTQYVLPGLVSGDSNTQYPAFSKYLLNIWGVQGSEHTALSKLAKLFAFMNLIF